MTPIACPKCASDNIIHVFTEAETFVDVYGCETCSYLWFSDDEPDDDVCAANEIIDDDDAAFAPPADSRESEDARY